MARVHEDGQRGVRRPAPERRERLGMSRRDLAEATGLSYPYISQLETGYRQPSPAAIQKLADALQFSWMTCSRRWPRDAATKCRSARSGQLLHCGQNASFAGAGAGAEPEAVPDPAPDDGWHEPLGPPEAFGGPQFRGQPISRGVNDTRNSGQSRRP